MKTYIQLYEDIVAKVKVFYEHLKLHKLEKRTGRKLSVTAIESIALSLFKQSNHIATKKFIWKIFQPHCSYIHCLPMYCARSKPRWKLVENSHLCKTGQEVLGV